MQECEAFEDAYDEGWCAAYLGYERTTNPHIFDFILSHYWAKGYDAYLKQEFPQV